MTNITVSLGGLSTFRRAELLGISLEEVRRLLRVFVGDVVEGEGGDVVGLAGLDQLVIFEEILLLGVVAVGLFLENALGFRSVRFCCQNQPWAQWRCISNLRGNVLEFHWRIQCLTGSCSKLISARHHRP